MERRQPAMDRSLADAAPRQGTLPTGYLLPHGEWWVGLELGRYDRSRRWQGTDLELVDARAALDDHAGEWHFGILAGRRWRSGIWLGTGLEHTGGRSATERFEHDLMMSTAVNTSIVVFENTILAIQNDTVLQVQERSETTTITGRSSTWRVPLLLGWTRSLRRWSFGAHVGLAGEWQRIREGYLFLEEVRQGGQVVHRTERVRDPDRSFGVLGAQLGLDAGFQFTERWRISAGPAVHAGLGVVLGQGAVQALPTRWGGQVRLSVDLSARPR